MTTSNYVIQKLLSYDTKLEAKTPTYAVSKWSRIKTLKNLIGKIKKDGNTLILQTQRHKRRVVGW